MKYLLVLACLVCQALCGDYVIQGDLDRARELEEQVILLHKLVNPEDVDLLVGLLGDDYDRLVGLKSLFESDNDILLIGDPDHPIFGGETDPDFSRPILGGEGDPDHSRPIPGGEGDPDHSRPILGGEGDPDHSRPILGGEGDPDHSRPIFGGEGDPDHSRPILGGEGDPDHSRLILGGEGDPDHSRLILGGEGDPDHDGNFVGGQSDPDEDTKITPDSEFDETADYPGKFGNRRPVPRTGNIKPILGKDPAKQPKKPEEDIPAEVKPCLPSTFPEPQPFNKLCSNPSDGSEGDTEVEAECPEYIVDEMEGEVCGFQIRKYNKGVWAMTVLNNKKEFGVAYGESLGRLAGYMSGENVGQVNMGKTKPATVTYIMQDKKIPKIAYLSMFLPVAYHEDPPKPLEDSSLVLKHNEELRFYVRSFGGRPTFHGYQREFAMLGAAIKKTGRSAVWYMPFVHEYSEPYDEEQRHEVAFLAPHLTST